MKPGVFAKVSSQDQPIECSEKKVSYGLVGTYFTALIGSKLLLNEESSAADLLKAFYFIRILNGVIIALAFYRLLHVLCAGKYRWGLIGILPLMWSPLFVQQSFAITGDTVIFLFMISTITIVASRLRPHFFDLTFYLIIGIIAACTKPFIVPLALIPVVTILVQRISENTSELRTSFRQWNIHEKLVLVASFGIVISGFAYFGLSGGARGITEQLPGVDSGEQLRLMLADPGRAFAILNQTILASFDIRRLYIALGWLDTDPIRAFSVVWIRLFYMALIAEFMLVGYAVLKMIRTRNFKMFSVALLGVSSIGWLLYAASFGGALALYLTFTPVGTDIVMGMQERYFLPQFFCAICASIMIYNASNSNKGGNLWNSSVKSYDLKPILHWVGQGVIVLVFFQFCILASSLCMTWLIRYW